MLFVQAAAVYFLVGLLGYAWRIRWLIILGVRVARGMPGPRARRRALATFAARPATIPPQVRVACFNSPPFIEILSSVL